MFHLHIYNIASIDSLDNNLHLLYWFSFSIISTAPRIKESLLPISQSTVMTGLSLCSSKDRGTVEGHQHRRQGTATNLGISNCLSTLSLPYVLILWEVFAP